MIRHWARCLHEYSLVERNDGGRRLELTYAAGACQNRTSRCATREAGLHSRGGLAVIGLLTLAAGCVGINPRWDGPVSESAAQDGDTTGDRGATGGTDGASSESTSSGSGQIVGTESSTDSGTDSSTDDVAGESSSDDSTGTPTPECPGMELVCDGECTDVSSDKRACGVECVDCTARFGSSAKCEQGECAPGGGGDEGEGGGDEGGGDEDGGED